MGARWSVGVQFNVKELQDLVRAFPSLGADFLESVGQKSKTYLKEQLLSGQELNLRAYPTDKAGRPTISVVKDPRRGKVKRSVKIFSYPVNLFEKGRGLPGGGREPGRYIITRKLKQAVSQRLGSYIAEFEQNVERMAT